MRSNMQDQSDPNRSNRTANAFTYLSASPSLNLIHRYESRLQRIMQRAMDNLLRLREGRPPRRGLDGRDPAVRGGPRPANPRLRGVRRAAHR